jgi:hypothetical protein
MRDQSAVLESEPSSQSITSVAVGRAGHSQFTLLVRHLLGRFVNNEMLSVGGETLPFLMTVAGAIAVPTLMVSVFLFPSYHAFPPKPPIPNFWTQVCEHYFFVVYAMVSMGLLTIFEADLFFPEPLDTHILSPLPISPKRMALARVCANGILLLLLLTGTNLFTIVVYPPVTELHVGRLFVANFCAVLAAAIFSAALCIAVTGVLSCVVPSKSYGQALAAVQCGATATLVWTLLVLPKFFPLLPELTRHARACWFPPFWFLGLYESVLAGPARLPHFVLLAHFGVWGTSAAILVAALSFPIAYVRRSRQAIEGSGVKNVGSSGASIYQPVLHASLLRTPQQKAIFHFISQSLRAPKHRVYLAMYAGLGLALICTAVFTIDIHGGSLAVGVNMRALEAVTPAVVFWTVAGLCSALGSPADPKGGWVFPVTTGAANTEQLDAVRIWVTVWAAIVSMPVVVVAATTTGMSGRAYAGQVFVAVALSVLLPDVLLFNLRTIPFTEIRIPLNTDLAWILLRYIVLLPGTVLVALHVEQWTAGSPLHFVTSLMTLLLLHSCIREANHRAIRTSATRSNIDELTGMLPGLGLNS